MPTMAELLTPDAIERLKAAPVPEPKPALVVVAGPQHARACNSARRTDGMRLDGDVMVHKACGLPMPKTSVLAGALAVPVTMPCGGGCGAEVTVPMRVAAPAQERLVVCRTCAAAMTTGSTVTKVVPAPKAAPIGVVVTTKEPTMNLDLIPSAQLGETIKRAERERLAANLPKKRKKAKDKADKREKAQVKAARAERKALTAVGVLPAFEIKGVEVPALDVSEEASLAEMPGPKTRSPYNKARYRLGEPLLPTASEPGIGVEATTWQTLVDEHQRLSDLAAQEPVTEPEAKPKKQPGKKARIAAEIDLTERQVAAIMVATGCSAKKARKILAAV